MQCSQKRIKLQEYDSANILNQLYEQDIQSQKCCDFYEQYKSVVFYYQNIIKDLTSQNKSQIVQPNQFQQNFNRSKSNDIQDEYNNKYSHVMASEIQGPREKTSTFDGGFSTIRTRNTMGPSSEQTKQKSNRKHSTGTGIISGQEAELQQKIERLQKIEKDQKEQIKRLEDNISNKANQIKCLNNQLDETEEYLVQERLKTQQLEQDLDKKQGFINQVNQEKNEQLDQIINLKKQNDELVLIMKREKEKVCQQLLDLDKEKSEFQLMQSKLVEDEKYLDQRRQEFKQHVKDSGQSMPQVAPIIEKEEFKQIQDKENAYSPPDDISKKIKFHQSEVYNIVTSSNGNIVATCGGDSYIFVYDVINQNIIGKIRPFSSEINTDICFSSFNDFMTCGSTNGKIQLYQMQLNKKKADFNGHKQKINSLQFYNDQTKFLSSSADKTVKIWDIQKNSVYKSFSTVSECKILKSFTSEPHVLTGLENGSVRMYSAKDGKKIYDWENVFSSDITNIIMTSNNQQVAVTCSDGEDIKILDVRKDKTTLDWLSHKDYINQHSSHKITYGPGEKTIIAGSSNGKVIFFDLFDKSKTKVVSSNQHEGNVIVTHYHEGSQTLFSGDKHGNFFVWK